MLVYEVRCKKFRLCVYSLVKNHIFLSGIIEKKFIGDVLSNFQLGVNVTSPPVS